MFSVLTFTLVSIPLVSRMTFTVVTYIIMFIVVHWLTSLYSTETAALLLRMLTRILFIFCYYLLLASLLAVSFSVIVSFCFFLCQNHRFNVQSRPYYVWHYFKGLQDISDSLNYHVATSSLSQTFTINLVVICLMSIQFYYFTIY